MRTFPAGPELLNPYPFFAEILRRLRELRLAEGTELEAVSGFFLHGMARLPMRFRAA
jgi:hypothetical protein